MKLVCKVGKECLKHGSIFMCKPEILVMILFDGVKTSEQAEEAFEIMGGVDFLFWCRLYYSSAMRIYADYA